MTPPQPRTLTHPDSKHVIEVDRDQVEMYLSQGWVEQAAKPAAKKSDESQAKE